MKVCVLIPTYNDQETIGNLVAEVRQKGMDAIVIDDGSTDLSSDRAREEGAIIIKHERNQGKGRALRDGFSFAVKNGYDAVITMDADGQHSSNDIDMFLQKGAEKAIDVIIGDRMSKTKNMPLIRNAANRLMSSFISFVTGDAVPDTQCGFKFIKRGVLEKLELFSEKFEIDSEILLKSSKLGFRIHSVPIDTIYKDEESRIKPIRDTLRFAVFAIRFLVSR
ncbi:MAG: hypothetical protein AUJ75_02525 [Candidatus Omnitrophica bacterium CG1_02_49_10]|nr:MAG: hypothetical protein AUJ75_02525 [Candidatus Omnitrophica bacterium CG1_02_49_10]